MDDKLRAHLEVDNGFYHIDDARVLRFFKGTAFGFVKEAGLGKVVHGVYCSEEAWVDRLFLIHLRNL